MKAKRVNINKSNISTVVSWFIIIVFCFAIFLQHQNVFMYFDDYGYASLTYGSDGPENMEYGLRDIFRFLLTHYLTWDGRQLGFLGEILCFRYGGLRLIQLVQSIIVIAIFSLLGLYSSSICSYSKKFCVPFSLLLFGLMSITTVKDGVYWFTASVLYLWPLLPFFIGIYSIETRKKESNWILLSFIFFLAAYSQEQVAVMVFITVWTYTLFLLVEKIFYKQILLVDISATIGALICILAPGNFARKNGSNYEEWYQIPFINRLIINLGKIIDINIGQYNWVLCFILTIFLGSAIYLAIPKRRYKIAMVLFVIAFSYEQVFGFPEVISIIFRAIWLLYFMGMVLYLTIKSKNFLLAAVVIGAICSQGMLLMSPSISTRSHTMYEIVLILLLEISIVNILKYSNRCAGINGRIIAIASIGVTAIYAACNFIYVFIGYHNNVDINWMNHYKMLEYSEKIKKCGDSVEDNDGIFLYKLNDILFSNMMPYQQGFDYIEYWMKNYYEIPQSIPIYWVSLGESTDFYYETISGEYYEDGWMGSECEVLLNTGEDRVIEFRIVNAAHLDNLLIYLDYQGEQYILNSDKDLQLRIPKGTSYIEVKASDTFKPEGGDQRVLSAILEIGLMD